MDDLDHSGTARLFGRTYLQMGDMDRALEFYRKAGRPDWFIQCLQHAHTPDDHPPPADLPDSGRWEWAAIECHELLGNDETAFRVAARMARTSGAYASFWRPGSRIVVHPEFPALAEELGLLAYWQVVGFPSNCRPEGDSVRCTPRATTPDLMK